MIRFTPRWCDECSRAVTEDRLTHYMRHTDPARFGLTETNGEPWFACDDPERPPDEWTYWHVAADCVPCAKKMTVELGRSPDDEFVRLAAKAVMGHSRGVVRVFNGAAMWRKGL